jgi:hypothetical protein
LAGRFSHGRREERAGGLFFASQKAMAQETVTDILKRYKDRGACV